LGTRPSAGEGLVHAETRDVLGGRAFLTLDDVELDALTFLEGLEALPVDRRVVDEAVLRTVLGGDEAEALGVVEPLHCSCRAHTAYLLVWIAASPAPPALGVSKKKGPETFRIRSLQRFVLPRGRPRPERVIYSVEHRIRHAEPKGPPFTSFSLRLLPGNAGGRTVGRTRAARPRPVLRPSHAPPRPCPSAAPRRLSQHRPVR